MRWSSKYSIRILDERRRRTAEEVIIRLLQNAMGTSGTDRRTEK
jgi:hypothetical protein